MTRLGGEVLDHHDFGGLREDLRLTGAAMKRRDVLRLVAAGGAGALYLLGCGQVAGLSDGEPGDEPGACARIPTETAGPFPGDGSNGPNVLNQAGVVRSDVRSSFAGLSGEASGVPLTLRLRLVDAANDCAPAPGRAVYMWHCDRAGRYSLYNAGVTDQNYLRGVQESDADAELTFITIFPGCYGGPLAAHPLRGVPQPSRSGGRAERDRNLAARIPRRRLQRGVCRRGIRTERAQPGGRFAGGRQRVQGRGGTTARGHNRRSVGGVRGNADGGGLEGSGFQLPTPPRATSPGPPRDGARRGAC